MQEICELTMLICFGMSWPISVWKSYKSRSTKGKSPIFILAIIVGYIAGIVGKFVGGQICEKKEGNRYERCGFEESECRKGA